MSGDSTDYSDDDCESLLRWLADAFGDDGPDTGRLTVTANIEWAGEYNKQAHRTTTTSTLDLSAVKAATAAGVAAQVAAARVARGRPPQGWHAQLRQLTGSKAGYAAADRAGLTVTARTLTKWLSDPDHPVRASDRAKIERAAIQMQYDRAARARERVDRAAREAADALSAAIEAEYGSQVRFFNITDLDINP